MLELDPPLLTETSGAQWSAAVVDAQSLDCLYEASADRLLQTASVAKVFALIELASRLQDGRSRPEELMDRRSVPPVGNSGLWRHLATDVLPLTDVATLIGAASDNLATNVLLDYLGIGAVQALARDIAPGGSMLHDSVRSMRGEGDPECISEGTARDWSRIMSQLNQGVIVNRGVSELTLKWLANGMDMSQAARPFLLDPLAHDECDMGVRVWNKTGTDEGVRAEIGIVRGRSRTVSFAVLCNWDEQEDQVAREDILNSMSEFGRYVRAVVGWGPGSSAAGTQAFR